MPNPQPDLPTDLPSILDRVDNVDPIRYARTRNFIDGDVTYLSPYISRGVISTKYVLERVLDRGFEAAKIEKFIQELAWREYYQRTWQAKGDQINSDLRHPQAGVSNTQIAASIVEATTGIAAVDAGVERLYDTGYMHNHIRMYTASIACNVGKSHWLTPARWMYYHLIDGDWASNAISWQWVAGSASNKKYFANQENIDRYCYTKQRGTFLDVDYSDFETIAVPKELSRTVSPEISTKLPSAPPLDLKSGVPTLIYNSYNLDPAWHEGIDANRVLLLEPSHFRQYPVSDRVIDHILALSRNINGIQVFVGDFDDLAGTRDLDIHFKEHPLSRHYKGAESSRDWMFEVSGYFSSFFSFWKKCEQQLHK